MVAFVPTCLILSASPPFLVTRAQDVGDFTHKGSFYTMTYKVNEDEQVTFDLDVPRVRVTGNALKFGPYPLQYAPIRRHSNTYRIDFDKSNISCSSKAALEWYWETFFKNNGIIDVDGPYLPAAGDIHLCYLTVLMILPSYHGITTDFRNRLHKLKRKGYAAVTGMCVYEKPDQTMLSFKVTSTVKPEEDVLIEIEFRGEDCMKSSAVGGHRDDSISPSRIARGLSPCLELSRDDLDVDQLADRIVLMRSPWQMPSDRMAHRNNIDVVSEYLLERYGCNFAVWNIGRSQRSLVEPEKFRNQVLNFALPTTEVKGQSLAVAPPSIELLTRFCSSLMFWLQLDRTRFVAVIHCRDTSPTTLLFIIAALVSTGVCAEVKDAVAYLRERYAVGSEAATGLSSVLRSSSSIERDYSLESSRSTIKFIEPSNWPQSLQRYAKYFQKMVTADAGVSRRASTFLLKMVIIDHFVPPASDIFVEVGELVLDPSEQYKSEIGLLATDNTYAVVDSDETAGSLTVDMTHAGEFTVVLKGDVGIVLKSRTKSRLALRYYFNTAFVGSGDGEGEIMVLTREDMDIAGLRIDEIPQDFKITLLLNKWTIKDQERFEDRKRKRAEDEAAAKGEHLERRRSISAGSGDGSPVTQRRVGKLSDVSPSGVRKGSDWSTVTLNRETSSLHRPRGDGRVFFDHHMLADSVRAKSRHHSDSSSGSNLTPSQRSCDPVVALMDRGYERLHAGVSLEVSDMNLFEAYAFCERYFPLSAAATSRSNGRAVSRASSLAFPPGVLPAAAAAEEDSLIDDFNRLHFFGPFSRGEGRRALGRLSSVYDDDVMGGHRRASSPASQRSFRSSLPPGRGYAETNTESISSSEAARCATQSEDLALVERSHYQGSRRQSVASRVLDDDDDDEYHLLDSSGGWFRMRYMSH
ncbi:hypothetical protein FOZ63_029101, partial [Perkinsus olseni]